MRPLVIYHADCTDGFAAAFSAWIVLGDCAEYLPMAYDQYADKPIDMTDREVYILDFSFERKEMEAIFLVAKRVVWLDHHKTAFEMWCPNSWGLAYHRSSPQTVLEECGQSPNKNHCVLLDNNKSGALLAWEYFHPDTEVPMLIKHIDDRDRWQFKLDGSKELHAALNSMKPWSFVQWKDFIPGWRHSCCVQGEERTETWLLREGSAILRAQDAHVQSMLRQARKCVIRIRYPKPGLGKPWDGVEQFHDCADYQADGLAINTPLHMSEVGHELANQSGTFGLVYYVGGDNKVKCSLRSNGDYDVSAIANVFGGGGHRNAAGFETDIDTLIGWLR